MVDLRVRVGWQALSGHASGDWIKAGHKLRCGLAHVAGEALPRAGSLVIVARSRAYKKAPQSVSFAGL